jgi:hypothetical protein
VLSIDEAISRANEIDFNDIPKIKITTIPQYKFKSENDGFVGTWVEPQKVFNYHLWGRMPFSVCQFNMLVETRDPDAPPNRRIEIVVDFGIIKGEYDENEVFNGWAAMILRRVDDTYAVKNNKFLWRFNDNKIDMVTLRDDSKETNQDFMLILLELQSRLMLIHSGCEAKLCIVTDKQKRINERRIKDGKKPIYIEKTIKIKPSVYYKPT